MKHARAEPIADGQGASGAESQSRASSLSVPGTEIANSHLDRAYAYEDQKKYRRALVEVERAIDAAPDLAEAHNLRGILLEKQQRKDEALAAYQLAVELDPAFVEAGENLSELSDELRQQEEAAGPGQETDWKSQLTAHEGMPTVSRGWKIVLAPVFLYLLAGTGVLFLVYELERLAYALAYAVEAPGMDDEAATEWHTKDLRFVIAFPFVAPVLGLRGVALLLWATLSALGRGISIAFTVEPARGAEACSLAGRAADVGLAMDQPMGAPASGLDRQSRGRAMASDHPPRCGDMGCSRARSQGCLALACRDCCVGVGLPRHRRHRSRALVHRSVRDALALVHPSGPCRLALVGCGHRGNLGSLRTGLHCRRALVGRFAHDPIALDDSVLSGAVAVGGAGCECTVDLAGRGLRCAAEYDRPADHGTAAMGYSCGRRALAGAGDGADGGRSWLLAGFRNGVASRRLASYRCLAVDVRTPRCGMDGGRHDSLVGCAIPGSGLQSELASCHSPPDRCWASGRSPSRISLGVDRRCNAARPACGVHGRPHGLGVAGSRSAAGLGTHSRSFSTRYGAGSQPLGG